MDKGDLFCFWKVWKWLESTITGYSIHKLSVYILPPPRSFACRFVNSHSAIITPQISSCLDIIAEAWAPLVSHNLQKGKVLFCVSWDFFLCVVTSAGRRSDRWTFEIPYFSSSVHHFRLEERKNWKKNVKNEFTGNYHRVKEWTVFK